MTVNADLSPNYQMTVSTDSVNSSGDDMVVIEQSDIIKEEGLDSHLEDLKSAISDRISDLKDQIADCDDPGQEMALKDEVMRFEEMTANLDGRVADTVKDLVARGDLAASDIQNNPDTVFEAAASEVRGLISDARAELSRSYENMGMNLMQGGISAADSGESVDDATACDVAGVDDVDASAEAAGDVDSANVEGASADELVTMLSTDPDAFMEEMRNVDPEERGATMMMVQQQLQEINQLFSMMSQFSQAMHDTQKAVIQNLRV